MASLVPASPRRPSASSLSRTVSATCSIVYGRSSSRRRAEPPPLRLPKPRRRPSRHRLRSRWRLPSPRRRLHRFAGRWQESVPAGLPPGPAAPAPPPPAVPEPVPVMPPAAGLNLEQRIGARWTTWVGAVAILFGAAFAVKLSIENNLI